MVATANTTDTSKGDRHTICVCCQQCVSPDYFNRLMFMCLYCLHVCPGNSCTKDQTLKNATAEDKRIAKE